MLIYAAESFCKGLLQGVDDGVYYPQLLDVRCVGIAVLDGELPLLGGPYLAEGAPRVVSKLLSRDAGILCGLFHHLGLHVVQTRELVDDIVVAILFGDQRNALFHELQY